MNQSKLHHGLEYETRAEKYLIENGYKIIKRNVRYTFGEIDIVAEHGSILVFIEVRKRDSSPWVTPEESVTFPKARRIRLAVQAYLARYRGKAKSARIDLIGFTARDDQEVLKHFVDFM